jgi:hypothetical protein
VSTENWATCVYYWTLVALILAILFAGGYTTWKVVTGYRDHRDALAIFGRGVRREAKLHHWRYEIVSARDEGLLLYLEKTHFIDPDRAIAGWKAGSIDALVASAEKAPALIRELRDASLSQLKSGETGAEQGRGYVLITR